ncbi:peptide ABC transporter ATP-binding protein [Hypericibacter terrae]|uniref:Peptide ABC transporter ATP-binding protein n=1 Tax=Hypericibacter terrae TaxID=2602015 RepID=A0A5J6MQ26_9PROT|nr:ABC transporter ATP-binding protein [Hypericibacter terrae]QEX18765.1 peptide ABC transporter ATP-binding protein [Hypericibacter terrae]
MLLSVERLSVSIGPARPLDDVGFALAPGEILGIVGESGAGKSLTAMAVMGLLPLIGGRIDGGAVWFDGVDLARLPEEDYRRLRGRRMALIMQNPMTSLDPITRVGEQIDQVSRLHMGLDRIAARARSIELMGQLKIPEPAAVHDLYPHQLSGGMKQRAVIAMALAADPELIVADEPTTALDVTVQAQIIQLLVELVRDRGLSLMLITHDMGVVAQACDRVAVMYGGRVVERGPVQAIFAQPRHPYTKALIGCIPRAGMAPGALKGIPGTVPSVSRYPSGCRFHPRCPQAQPLCQETVPVLDGGPTGDGVACHFPNGPRP